MIRIETKHLFNEGVSPHIKSLVMKRRVGIKLTEKEESKLKRFSESVSMVEIPKNRTQVQLPKPIEEPKSFDDLGDDEELDMQKLIDELMLDMELQEILEEMGYEG
jgi:hypothetical protein